MADPKGPESGQNAKGAPSARPRSQTLDLSANDVTPKPAAPQSASGESAAAGAVRPAAAQSQAGSSASAASSASSSGATKIDPHASAQPSKSAAEAASTSAAKPNEPATATAAEPAKSAASEPAKPAGPSPGAPAAPAKSPEPGKTATPEPAKPAAADKPSPVGGPDSAKPATPPPPSAAAAAKPADQPPGAVRSPPASGSAGPTTSPRGAPPPAAATVSKDGYGLLGIAAAAVAGAAIAVLIIAIFGKQLIRAPEPDMSRVTAAESKLDAVGRDVSALRDQIGKAAQSRDTSAIEKRLGEIGKTIEASNARAEKLEGEVRGLGDKVAKPSVDPAAVAVLAGRLDGVDLRLRNTLGAEAMAAIDARFAELEARAKDAATAEQMAALASRVAAFAGLVDAAVAPVGERISAVEAALKARPVGDPAARRVVALGALEQALDAGRPFAAELAAVKAASRNGELSGLDPYAAAGVPTRAALASELGAIVATLPPSKAPPDASVFGRFVASAGSIVKVTPKSGPGAAPAADGRPRLAQLASNGDVEQALAARQSLDEADQAATEDWAKKATARVAADKALATARAAALGGLAATD